MRILIASGKDRFGMGQCFGRALAKMGEKIEYFFDDEIYDPSFPRLKNRYTNRLFWKLFSIPLRKIFLKKIEETKPDLIFIIKGYFFNPRVLKKIKKLYPRTTLICFYPDYPFKTSHPDVRYHGLSNSWTRHSIGIYDIYFIWGKCLVGKIRDAGGKNVTWLPFSIDPENHHPVSLSAEELPNYKSDVAFIGSWDTYREKLLRKLLNYDLKIWGNGWQKAGPDVRAKWQRKEVTGENYAKACTGSKIVLDILRPHMTISHSIKIFEVPACNGFLLSDRGGEFHYFLEEEKELALFSDPEDMVKKIDFYLKHPEIREKMKVAAHNKIMNSNHAYLDQAKTIMDVLAAARATMD